MAEKEERILIKKQINYHPPYGGWCGDGKEIVLTRQEAIKKTRKAIEERAVQMVGESLDSDPYKNPLAVEELADAALDALLGDGK